MRLHRAFALLTALLTALLPTPALPAPDIPAATPGAASWIQVELIVFRNLDTSTAADEQWPAQPALAYPDSVRFLLEPGSTPVQDATPAAEAMAEESAAAKAPVPFALLGSSERLLADAAARIAGSQNYRVLAHLSWRQPAPGNGAEHILVTGGRPWGDHRELEGYVSVSRANFVHVATHLWLNDFADAAAGQAPAAGAGVTLPPVPRPPEPAPAPQTTLAAIADPLSADGAPMTVTDTAAPAAEDSISVEPARALRSVLLDASRRVAPGEVHYIDHPLFGAVLKVEPWDPDAAANPAPVPAPTPGAQPAAPAPTSG
jgi:hypothetical protein